MLKAVVCDMDGVLIDSEPVHMEAHKRIMEKLNLPFEKDYYMQFVGSTTDYMWAKMIKDFSIDLSPDELMKMSDEFVKEINGEAGYPVMEGAKNIICTLKDSGLKLAVASSSGISRIEQSLDKIGVRDEFDVIVSGMKVENPKPAPDVFLKAAEELNVSPDECIVIEDSLNGMKAAKNAGMICVMYENSSLGKQDSTYADYVLQGFSGVDEKFFSMVYSHCKGEP